VHNFYTEHNSTVTHQYFTNIKAVLLWNIETVHHTDSKRNKTDPLKLIEG